MRSFIYTPVIALVMLLGACTGTNTVERVTLACNGYAETLETLTVLYQAGKLSNAQAANIDRAELILTPACLSDPENITDSLLSLVENAMLEMILLEGSVK